MRCWTLAMTALFAAAAPAAVQTKVVEYTHDGVTLEGFFAGDDSAAPKPGVLVVHDWLGNGEFSRHFAERVAGLGYAAFAVDMYGKGQIGKGPQDGMRLSGPFRTDRPLMRARVAAGLEALKKQKGVDPAKVACLGFCFGGTTSLELARSGADLRAVVSFHGNLATPNAADAKNIKAKVLALHGADDPFVPAAEVAGFEKEMRDAKVDWQLVAFGNAVHSFTEPKADGSLPGAKYNQKAAKRSFEAMKDFLAEAFAN